MIIQIDQLFINVDNIVAISPYNAEEGENIVFGLIINGIKYILFVVPNKNKEELDKTSKKIINILSTIINNISVHPVQKLNIVEKEEKDA